MIKYIKRNIKYKLVSKNKYHLLINYQLIESNYKIKYHQNNKKLHIILHHKKEL